MAMPDLFYFSSKGQSSIEHMITIGWTLVIIAVAGGILVYSGVFSPGKLAGKTKAGFGQIEVVDWTFDSQSDEVKILLENRVGVDINITSISIDGSAVPVSIYIHEGQRLGYFVSAGAGKDLKSTEFYKTDVIIAYNRVDASGSLSSAGKLTATAN